MRPLKSDQSLIIYTTSKTFNQTQIFTKRATKICLNSNLFPNWFIGNSIKRRLFWVSSSYHILILINIWTIFRKLYENVEIRGGPKLSRFLCREYLIDFVLSSKKKNYRKFLSLSKFYIHSTGGLISKSKVWLVSKSYNQSDWKPKNWGTSCT